MREILSWLSGIVFAVAYVPYILGILKKGKRPMRSSWFIWAVLDSIALWSMYVQHALNPSIVASTLGCWTVFILSLRHGKPGFGALDVGCLIASMLGIGLWIAFDSPLFGLALSLTIIVVGTLPTLASAWRDPADEDALSWSLYAAACVLAVIAVPRWVFADAAQPVVYLGISGPLALILLIFPNADGRA